MFFLENVLSSAYGLNDCAVVRVDRGTMNQCYRVESGRTIRFLKSYATRFYEPEQILRSCEVQLLVHRAGLPTPRIIPNYQGNFITISDKGFYVLSEFAFGHEYARNKIPDQAAYHMGVMLARLQGLLKDPRDVTPIKLLDPYTASDRLQKLLMLAEVKEDLGEVDAVACQILRYKIDALHRQAGLFAQLQEVPAQRVHGDYQVSNLVFSAENQVSAILDFDQLQRRPRGLEMMRALDFSFSHDQILEQPGPQTSDQPGLGFFRGYAEAAAWAEAPLTEEEVRLFASLWTYYWLVRPWPLDVRYERPEDYDVRWDSLIQPPSDWWEQNMDAVTEGFLRDFERL